MPIHDYKCCRCNTIERDCTHTPTECYVCKDSRFAIFYGEWGTVKLRNNGHCLDEREDAKGNIQRFEVRDDPLCKKELSDQPDLNGIKSFTNDQSNFFRNKLAKDGDSSNLRREILKQRNENLGNKRQASWE